VSKRGNMIKMVTLLQNRGRMKTSELARELEVSERQIRTYRNDLEMGGIFINYKCGRYGGYELASPYLNFIDLSVNELATLNKVRDQLHADESQHLLDYNSAYEKLIALYKHRGELRNYTKYFMARDRTDFLGRFYENNNSEEITMKLKIRYPFSMIVSERIWAEDQKTEWVDSDTIVFTARLYGRREVIGWILSMGRYAKVLEPEELVLDIRQEIMQILTQY